MSSLSVKESPNSGSSPPTIKGLPSSGLDVSVPSTFSNADIFCKEL